MADVNRSDSIAAGTGLSPASPETFAKLIGALNLTPPGATQTASATCG